MRRLYPARAIFWSGCFSLSWCYQKSIESWSFFDTVPVRIPHFLLYAAPESANYCRRCLEDRKRVWHRSWVFTQQVQFTSREFRMARRRWIKNPWLKKNSIWQHEFCDFPVLENPVPLNFEHTQKIAPYPSSPAALLSRARWWNTNNTFLLRRGTLFYDNLFIMAENSDCYVLINRANLCTSFFPTDYKYMCNKVHRHIRMLTARRCVAIFSVWKKWPGNIFCTTWQLRDDLLTLLQVID